MVHKYLIIVGGIYPKNNDEVVSGFYAHPWQEAMKG